MIQRLESLGVAVVHVYGLTEVYGPFTICEEQDSWSALPPDERAEHLARQGVAMIQADLARVVTQEMADVPRDGHSVGEVVLRGNNVMLGYYNDAEATELAFRGGWFHTGDLAVMHADGYLEIVDRAKDVIISGGENISSIEVEKAILSHPDVLDAAVVSYPHPTWGERPKAYVSLRADRHTATEDILSHVRSLIAGFKVPDYLVLVPELPRTATGKVTKNALRALSDETPSRPGARMTQRQP